MVTGFIALCILPNQPSYICLVAATQHFIGGKQFIYLFRKFCLAAVQFYHPTHVLWRCKTVMPRIAFCEKIIYFGCLKRTKPKALYFPPYMTGRWVKQIFVLLCPQHVFFIHGFVSNHVGELCNAPIVVSILHRFRSAFMVIVVANKPFVDVMFQPVTFAFSISSHGL